MKKRKINFNIFLKSKFKFIVILFVFFTSIFADQQILRIFINRLMKFKNNFPDRFVCEVQSNVFDEYLKQLPDEAFIDRKKHPPRFYFHYSKNKFSYFSVTNIVEEYKPVILSDFKFFAEIYKYLNLPASKIEEMIKTYKIEYKRSSKGDLFLLNDEIEKKAVFIFFNKVSCPLQITTFLNKKKYANIHIKYFTIKRYILPKLIEINLFVNNIKYFFKMTNYNIEK